MRKNLRGRMPRLRFDRMFRAQYIIVRSGEAATRRLWGAGEARVRHIFGLIFVYERR